jgi:ferredoxin
MPEIILDGQTMHVAEGATILDAANAAGIEIPTLCHLKETGALTSCMLCLVKDEAKGRMVLACGTRVEDGMRIDASSADVRAARRDVLQLIVNEHVGDCEAPCRRSCPSSLNIPGMLRLVQEGRKEEAARLAKDALVLPEALGWVCPAPCEKACRRGAYDTPLRIQQTHREVSEQCAVTFEPAAATGKSVAVVGSGPAGLAAAWTLRRHGHACVVYEKADAVAPVLRVLIGKNLPESVLDREILSLRNLGIEFVLGKAVGEDVSFDTLLADFDAVIVACDASVPDSGKIVSLKEVAMVVRSVANGKEAAARVEALFGAPSAKDPFDSRMGPIAPEALETYVSGRVPPEALPKSERLPDTKSEAARCLHCDCHKPVACKLRRYAREYGVKPRGHVFRERPAMLPLRQAHRVAYDAGKCIKCGICVEITRRNGEPFGMAFHERGFDTFVGVPFGRSLEEGLGASAEACALACPTGALSLVTPDAQE